MPYSEFQKLSNPGLLFYTEHIFSSGVFSQKVNVLVYYEPLAHFISDTFCSTGTFKETAFN